MAQYEIIMLGCPNGDQLEAVRSAARTIIEDFGLPDTDGLTVRTAEDFAVRDTMAANVALYFGGNPDADVGYLVELEAARTPIIPVLSRGAGVAASLPTTLRALNVCFIDPLDKKIQVVCALAFEGVGLLHEQRRVFVSYRRDESREMAVQLFDELSARGFDVFLDTHSIRPGSVFQQTLWHRLADCDVVIMIDTSGYFDSKWTKQELGRAMAHGIHVLRLVWPEHTPTRFIDLSETIRLGTSDLNSNDRVDATMVSTIAYRCEALRSKSVAWRHRILLGKLRAEVLRVGGRFQGVGAHHLVPIELPNGLEIQAYPAVGVPTAMLLNEIYERTTGKGDHRRPCIVYDDTGIGPAWLDHMRWLDKQIENIKAIRVASAAWEFAGWDA